MQSVDQTQQYKEFNLFCLNLTKDCFENCVSDYTNDRLQQQETTCIKNCASRSLVQQNEMQMVMKRVDEKFGDRF